VQRQGGVLFCFDNSVARSVQAQKRQKSSGNLAMKSTSQFVITRFLILAGQIENAFDNGK